MTTFVLQHIEIEMFVVLFLQSLLGAKSVYGGKGKLANEAQPKHKRVRPLAQKRASLFW